MMIVTAHNITEDGKLFREDGTADYDVWVGINLNRIWGGKVDHHIRGKGAAELLRRIADAMEGK